MIIPPHPGITSAIGLLTTDLRYDAVRTAFQICGSVDLPWLEGTLRDMAADIAAQFEADGVAAAGVRSPALATCVTRDRATS